MNNLELYLPLLSEIIIGISVLLIMFIDAFSSKKTNGIVSFYVALIAVVSAFVFSVLTFNTGEYYLFYQQFHLSNVTVLLSSGILVCLFFILIYGREYLSDNKSFVNSYYMLALLSTLGGMVLVSAGSFLSLYVGLELLSLPLYAMIAINKNHKTGIESAIKYFVLGAVASGILLYGLSLLYGLTGTLSISEITIILNSLPQESYMIALLSMVFFMIVISFKLGIAPFHQWVPDVYHGSLNVVTVFLATIPKLAGFGMLIILIVKMFGNFSIYWSEIFLILGVLCIVFGNLVALVQTNIKKMFGYSAVSHVGFILLSLSVANDFGYSMALYYTLVYVLMSLGSFGVLLVLSKKDNEIIEIDDLKGLNKQNPWMAFMMLLALFSMAGIPPFVGFTAKMLVLLTLVKSGSFIVATIALLMSVIAAYYYLKVIKAIYFDDNVIAKKINIKFWVLLAISINCLALLYFGIFPTFLTDITSFVF